MSSRLQERTDSFKQQLLTAQRRHLIGHLETTISGYEEQIDRQQKLLDAILQPEVKVRGAAVFPADVQQLSVIKDEVLPEQQEWSRHQFQDLKDLFKQQLLTAPQEDLIGHFETTISRYQKEIDRRQKLLDVILQPEIKLRRAVVPADVQQLFVSKEEFPPEQQERSPSLDQKDPEPPHIKDEQQEVCTTKFPFTPVPEKTEDDDEEKPQSSQLHQAQTEQMETEADGEDCGGPEPDCQVSNDDENTREAHLGLNFLKSDGYNSCEKRFSCSECGKQFKRTSYLKRHMRTHTEEKPFTCSVCGKRYARKAHLQYHFRCHTGEKPFSCSHCDKRFSWRDRLLIHMRTHTGEKPFRCKVCDQRFTWHGQLKKHKCGGESSQLHELSTSQEQEDPEAPHIKEEQEEVRRSQEGEQLQTLEGADITKFTFTPVPVKAKDDDDETKPQSSQFHQRQTEQMGSEADGEDCGGSEPTRNSYPDTHLTPGDKTVNRSELEVQVSNNDENTREAHLGLNYLNNGRYNSCKKRFNCSECGKQFNQNSNLKRHMKTHTKEKPFSCSVCGKMFALKTTLQYHFRCHTGEKPFSCSHCGKCFSRRDRLSMHMRTHTGEKPYSCKVCEERFTWYGQLKRHKCGGESSQLHERSTSREQEDPETPHIKEEQEEVWRSQEGEQLQTLEGADITKFTFTPIHVKSEENDEIKPQSSQLHQKLTEQMKTEAEGEDCGRSEPARNSGPDTHLTPETDDKTVNHSELGVQVSNDDGNTRDAHLGLNYLNNDRYNSCKKRASCSECGKQFNQNSNLKRHMRTHTKEKPFSCSICGKTFALKTTLHYHFRCHTGEKPFSCSHCGKCFSRRDRLSMHMRTHTGEKPYSCNICEERFTWYGQLKRHKCGGELSQLHELKSSQDQQDPETPHIKEEQEEVWTSQEGEQLQRLEGADITKFTFTPVPVKTEEDDEEKLQSSQLHQSQTEENRDAEHLKTAADGEDCGGSKPDSDLQTATRDKTSDSSDPETDDSCDWEKNRDPHSGLCNTEKTSVSSSECTATSGDKGHLEKHKGIPTEGKPFSCPVCGNRFRTSQVLRRHMTVHTGEKPFSCSVCGKRFTQQGSLNRHLNGHPMEKPFSCSICDKRFAQKRELSEHSTVHVDDKPFSCSVCGKGFAERRFLRRHVKIHADDKPCKCSVCGKVYEKRYLRQHMEIHSNEKPFSCSVCGKAFEERRYLRRHMKIHTEEKPFICSVCCKVFREKHNLTRHMRIHTV